MILQLLLLIINQNKLKIILHLRKFNKNIYSDDSNPKILRQNQPRRKKDILKNSNNLFRITIQIQEPLQ